MAALAGATFSPRLATASTAIEYPDNWTAQFSRGGAWLADASDPIAVFYNPAMLSLQPNGVSAGANLPMQEICFTRKNEQGEATGPAPSFTEGKPGAPELPYGTTCNEHSGFPRLVPNLSGVWLIS